MRQIRRMEPLQQRRTADRQRRLGQQTVGDQAGIDPAPIADRDIDRAFGQVGDLPVGGDPPFAARVKLRL